MDGETGRLIITHKDRLLRFSAELVFVICAAKQVEVVILNQGEDTTFEKDLAKDVLEIITVFSACLYGSRSRNNQKLLDGVRQAYGGITMLIAHKIALDLNNIQATYMSRAAGTARFAYNWALAEWRRQYEAWKADHSQPNPSQMAVRRQLNVLKREQFLWMLDVTKCTPKLAIIQLEKTFQNFFSGSARYPQFRKKKGVHDRFSLSNDQFSLDNSRIHIPNLC